MKLHLNCDWNWPTAANGNSKARWAAALLPPHLALVEACGGVTLMATPLSKVEIYNDLNGQAHNYFSVARNAQQRRELVELVLHGSIPMMLNVILRDPIINAGLFHQACCAAWVPDLSERWLKQRRDNRPFSDGAKLLNPIIERFYHAQIEDLPPDNVILRYDAPKTAHLVDLALVDAAAIPPIIEALQRIRGKAVVLGGQADQLGPLQDWRRIVQSYGDHPHTALANFPERRIAA